MNKHTLVLGASENPSRYSYLAVERLVAKNYSVTAIGRKAGKIGNINIITEQIEITDLDTITVYLNAENQKQYYNYILALNPKRIIFNPGAENDELEIIAKAKGIEVLNACTLVLLSIGKY